MKFGEQLLDLLLSILRHIMMLLGLMLAVEYPVSLAGDFGRALLAARVNEGANCRILKCSPTQQRAWRLTLLISA